MQDAYAQLLALHEQARQTAIVDERNRLAREIHDTLAHYLTIVNVQLEAADKLGPGKVEQALTQVRRARRLTVDCLQEVRRSVAALRSPTLKPSRCLRKTLRHLQERFPAASVSTVAPQGNIILTNLTNRELDVLNLIGTGATNKEIGERLALTEGTVKNYISMILTKTGLRDRTQAALFAARNGLVKQKLSH